MPSLPTLTPAQPGSPAPDPVALRVQAGELLNRLIADREASEQRLAASGRRDPLKTVTGATALERAIAATREMIADMDLMLAELDSGIEEARTEEPIETESRQRGSLVSAGSTLHHRAAGMLFGKRPVAASA